MGALHAGHRSLMSRAREECDRVVVSIFVNPTQFGAHEDFDRYPRPLDDDLKVCAEEAADAVYLPQSADVYPPGFATTVSVSGVTAGFEGARRPGHFDGVATVVSKLLITARPHRAYFGRKDAQQCAVVQRLAADLDTGVEIVVCPVIRDGDGLALSSRNRYLSAEERSSALAIPAALAAAAAAFEAGERSSDRLLELARAELAAAPGLEIDYVALVDETSFTEVDEAGPGNEICIAVRIGATRLIDVIRLGVDAAPVLPRAGHRGGMPAEAGAEEV